MGDSVEYARGVDNCIESAVLLVFIYTMNIPTLFLDPPPPR